MFSCAWRARGVVVCLLLGCCLRAETAILQIRVVQGEGSVYPAGARAPNGIVVQVTDETGGPVEGARVSFLLPDEGPSGTFAPGIRTSVAVTAPDGKATAPGPMLGFERGAFRVRVIAVKDQARAGTVVNQFASAATRPASPVAQSLREQPGPRARRGGGRGRILLVLGAAAAGGLAVGLTRQGSSGTQPQVAAVAVPRIGTPSITVGRP